MTATSPGLVELVDICHSMQQRNIELFARLGAIVTNGEAGSSGRLFAEACHRHAWHADLWAARRPVIPVEPTPVTPTPVAAGDEDDHDGDVVGAYRAEIDVIRELLRELTGRVNRDLDPSTVRVIELVSADLTSIDDRLACQP